MIKLNIVQTSTAGTRQVRKVEDSKKSNARQMRKEAERRENRASDQPAMRNSKSKRSIEEGNTLVACMIPG